MQDSQYSRTSRLFHWGMAALILSTLPAGYLMVQPWVSRSLSTNLFLYHKNLGVVLIVLVLARLIWRWRNPAPPLPAAASFLSLSFGCRKLPNLSGVVPPFGRCIARARDPRQARRAAWASARAQ